MVSFYVYDIVFLVLFTLFVVWFLYSRRKNLKREGILYLYKTKWGIKLIDKIGDKHKKLFKVLDWFSIISGYILMVAGIWFVYQLVNIYIIQILVTGTTPIKVFPLLPVIPYTPELFKLSFLPPFYFTYWILALAVIAIGHEFSHGIFARAKGIKIKSTGFGFLGPFIAAFVEPDEKKLQKVSAKKQIAVLSAGTFANIILTFLFLLIFMIFFYAAFTPSGYIFSDYGKFIIPVSNISGYGNYSNSLGNFTEVFVGNKTYFTNQNLKNLNTIGYLVVYDNTPAFRVGLQGAITQINNVKIKNQADLQRFLMSKKPGDNITITTLITNDKGEIYNLTLAQNPFNGSVGYIGIGSSAPKPGIISKIVGVFTGFIEPNVYYAPKIDGTLIIFIRDLFFWIILLNLSVAIVNMIPLGIFDGGRVFYLTMLSIFKSEKIAKRIFQVITYIILFIVLAMVVLYFFAK